MPISTILINVRNVRRSVDFYVSHLGAGVIGEVTDTGADLDFVTATIRLARVTDPEQSTWIPDDLQRGFRHVGFKVDAVDPMVAELDGAGVEFHLRPIDATGGVRIAFFFDPDGTLLELVQGDLDYHDVHDEDGVARERGLGIPSRPRFDHVAVTAADATAIDDRYRPLGFRLIGSIHQTGDPRGFEIDYLKGGDTVLEVFTFTAPTTARAPQTTAPGFAAVMLESHPQSSPSIPAPGTPIGSGSGGRALYADPDGLVFAVTP
jgi:catechol 2,3-dioxygenase-like lactoylglutathione lyase family enzyme